MARQREGANLKADEPTIAHDPSGTEPQTTSLRGQPAEKVGGTIGPYKLLDELGEGGMGTVYLAEQDRPVRRRVALKIIKPGLDTAQVIARFEAERQALALMDHSNIARVLDAGTTASGRPYFVMEWVQGVPITSYCDQHRLTLRERLALFLPICRAVQHAHQKGIIHRDLKPSNILVTLRDDQAIPKIIDFGIAKATTQRLTERTLYTQYGQLVGTPDYMSPEQAGMGGIDVDTRSDVYSLGAIFYELLCGDTPLGQQRLRQLDFVAMLNMIYEHEPPPPSRRIAESGDQAAEIARRRNTEPQKLAHGLRGELDWIATKALEKERIRRYESPSALAADIERHLNNQPVEASPPSAVYRVRKFIRRNRAGLAAAAAIALVLIGGIVVSGWQAYRATQAEHDMAIEREAALEAKGLAEARRRDAENAKQLADAQRKLAEEAGGKLAAALAKAENAADKERDARSEIEQRLREADAMRLAMYAKDSLQRFPQRALLLAAEAVETTRRKSEPIRSAAHQALHEALDNIGGRAMSGHQGSVTFLELAPNGRWLFTSDAQSVRRWDLAHDDPAQASVLIGAPDLNHHAVAISPDGLWLATLRQQNNTSSFYLWNLERDTFDQPVRQIEIPAGQAAYGIRNVVFSPNARSLAATAGPAAWVWDLSNESTVASPITLNDQRNSLNQIAIGASGQWAVTFDYSGKPTLWDLKAPRPAPRPLSSADLRNAEVNPDGKWIVAFEPSARSHSGNWIWDLTAKDPTQTAREVPLDARRGFGNPAWHFLADGQTLAVAAGDRITLWDLADEKPMAPKGVLSVRESALEDPAEIHVEVSIRSLLSDPTARWLLAVDQFGLISRWDLRAQEPNASRFVVGRHPGGDVTLKLSPSGRWLVSTRVGEAPLLWDLQGRNPRATGTELRGHDVNSYGAIRVAMGGGRLTALATTNKPIRLPFAALGARVRDSLGLGERWIVTGASDATLRLWDLRAEDPTRSAGRVGSVKLDGRNVAMREDGSWVTVLNGSLRSFETADLSRPKESVNVRAGMGMHFSSDDKPLSPDGRWLAIHSIGSISVFDLDSEELLGGKTKTALEPTTNSPSTPSNRAAPESPVLWNPAVQAGRWLQSVLNPPISSRGAQPGAHRPHRIVDVGLNHQIQDFVIGPHGRWLLIRKGQIVRAKANVTNVISFRWWLYDLQTPESSEKAIDIGEVQQEPIFSPDGRWLAACARDETRNLLALWRLGSEPAQTAKYDLGQNIYPTDKCLAFSGDGRWLTSCLGPVQLWSIADDGKLSPPQTLAPQAGSRQRIAISHDGRFVAASSYQAVDLWDRNAQTPAEQQHILRGHEQTVDNLAFSPDGAWLASASGDGDIRLWDLRDDQLQDTMIALGVANTSGYHLDFNDLLFSRDGHWLLAGTWNGTYVWNLNPASLLVEARRLAGRELTENELAQFRLNTPDRLRERLLRQAAEVSAQLEKDPQDILLLRRRIELFAAAGDFPAAIDDLHLLTRLRPDDHWNYYCLLPLLAQTEQAEEFRRVGQEMIKRFRDPPPANLEILERAVKGCLFWPDAPFDWEDLAPLADRALEKASASKHWVLPWTHIAKGLAEYRLGNYRAALEWADKGLSDANASIYSIAVPGNFVKSIAHAQLDELNGAQSALAAAKKAHAAVPAPPQTWSGWNDWYMGDIMLREAEAVLLEKAPPGTVAADQ